METSLTYFSYHSRQVDAASWSFLVLPIDKQNLYRLSRGWYIYIWYIDVEFFASHFSVRIRSRPNQIAGPGPKSGPAGKSESRGPKNIVSRWRRSNTDIYSQNHHFGLVYDMICQFLGMDAKNFKFGMFCQQCHPSVASGDADIWPRNASRIHNRHLFTS